MKLKTESINRLFILLFALVMLMPVSMSAQTEYALWIGGTQVTSDNAQNITGENISGTVSYEASTKTLTLRDAVVTGNTISGGCIISGLDALTIAIAGYNTITTNDSCTAIRADAPGDQTLTIVKAEDDCSLYFDCPRVIRCFSSLTITDLFWEGEYTYGLAQFEDGTSLNTLKDAEGQEVSYATLTDVMSTPSMYPDYDQEKGQAGFGFEGDPNWEIRYSIDYVDESTPDVTNARYNMMDEGFVPLLGPCTVTGWRVVGNNTSPVVTGKLFNLAETWLEMMEGEVAGVPALVPAADPDDDLQIDYTDNDEQVANYIGDGLVEAVSAGTTTFYVSVWGGDLTPYTVLNGESMHFTVNVSSYGLKVSSPQLTDVPVTKSNMEDVLGDGGSVQFDGHNRLVLNNAQLTSIELSSTNSLPDDGLIVYLEGESTIENIRGAAVISEAATYNPKLTFQTGSDAPGSLVYTCTSPDRVAAISQGFDVTYKDHLALLQDGSNTLTVKVPLGLIVDQVGTPATVTYTSSPGGSDTTPLDNDIIDKILYTLDDNGTSGAPDGYDGNEHAIVFNTTMTDEAVAAINTDEKVPGSDAYAAAFKGMTFIVPAGKGDITLKLKSSPGYAFHVMVGYQTPAEVVNHDDYDDVVVPFACSEASYVKIYLVETTADARMAGIDDDRRAGPKATVSGGIGGMSVSSSLISVAPNASSQYRVMGAGDYDRIGRHIVVNATDVTDLADNAFGFSPVASARGAHRTAVSDHITYIDASNTMITGKHYSRQEGAFKDVPEGTFIYLPAGNTAEGKNFIIGGVCQEMTLAPDSEEEFEVAETFTASQVALNRVFLQSVNADEYYTIFLPYSLAITTEAGDFFAYDSFDDGKAVVKMKKLEPASETSTTLTLDANTAYFFKPAAAITVLEPLLCVDVEKQTVVSDPADESESEGLHGVYKYYEWSSKPSSVFSFTTTEQGGIRVGEFAKVDKGMTLKPFQAYLRIHASEAVESLVIDWGDGTTSIGSLTLVPSPEGKGGEWYSVDGLRLNGKPTRRGVYIHHGNKVVIK